MLFFNLEGRCEVPDEVPRSRSAIRFKSHRRYRLRHFYLQSMIANPTCLYRNHTYPLHCVGYDVKGICTLCMRSRACFDSDIFNENHRFPNPPGPFTYPRTSLRLNSGASATAIKKKIPNEIWPQNYRSDRVNFRYTDHLCFGLYKSCVDSVCDRVVHIQPQLFLLCTFLV